MKKAELQELQTETHELLKMWQELKMGMDKALLTEQEITKEEEGQFLESKSSMSKMARTLQQRLPSDLRFGGDKMVDLLKNSLSLQHFRSIPESELPLIHSQWHSVWINLSRSIGGLDYLADGGRPSPKKEKGQSISKLKRGKKSSKKSLWKKVAIFIVVAGAAFGAAVFLELI